MRPVDEGLVTGVRVDGGHEALVDAEPHKFMLPGQGDMRYNWVVVRLAEIDHAEMTELVVDALQMAAWRRRPPAGLRQEGHGDRAVGD